MDSINAALAAVLQTVQTPGDFFAAGECALHLPLVEVDSVGPIALPVLPAQAAQLIAVAERAPYGRGEDTLVDTAVRRTWQIGADRVHIKGRHWNAMLEGVVERASTGLGAGAGVEAELYKLLVYDEGSFFVEHRDIEKSPGMFATLIVALPSLHTGGELVIRHREREARLDLRCTDVSELAWAAFYADCVHEVLPITSGYRLVLVYNLRRKGRGRLPRPPSYDKEKVALERLLRVWCNETAKPDEDQPLKLVYPLAHAYTPAELSFAALKGADAAAATVLTAAAGDAACDLHLALLRIEESGAAEYNGHSGRRWRSRYHDDDEGDDDDGSDDAFRVAEIFDRALTLSDWRGPDGGVVSLGTLPFNDGEVCPPDALADMEPDEQHFHEATGNEGASFERSYQRAALVLWPQVQRLRLIARAGLAASLPALGGIVGAWIDGGAEPGHAHWHDAHALAAEMLACWPVQTARRANDSPSTGSAMLLQLVRLQDRELIDSMVTNVVAAGAYAAGDNAALTQALKLLPASRVGALLLAVVQGNADLHIGGCADLLASAVAVSAWRGQLLGAAQALLDAMPGDPARPQSPADAWRREGADAGVVHDTLRALAPAGHAGLSALADQAVTHWLAWPKTFGMDAVIVPALRRLAERPALLNRPAVQRLRSAALDHLRARTSQDLAPPADWRREARLSCRCEHCLALGRFLQSADQEAWRFKAREAERRHVEDSIRQGRCDVDCSTERKGSPHVLVCTKNLASYERRVAQRRADLDDLTRLKA
ncbi:MAG: 2OG-Fe(II) oxygenase [Burkholderiaceae bacterium]|nr:2OG-Fe(II) oxygenase [Aquabacterium sp.]NUP85754.1 2OG-Fe(II) oxygenase [Burkholderiaceae bacterium]